MTDDRSLPFAFPAVHGKKITAAFNGRRITSNGGVMILAAAALSAHPPALAGNQDDAAR